VKEVRTIGSDLRQSDFFKALPDFCTVEDFRRFFMLKTEAQARRIIRRHKGILNPFKLSREVLYRKENFIKLVEFLESSPNKF